MVLASLVAENPEREQVIYSIFSPENLVSFDEVWSVIEGFGNEYFIDIYKKRLQNDSRPRIKKFYHYFIGKLYLAEGEEEEALQYFKQALSDPEINDQYHVMLKARVYEGLALASDGDERSRYTQECYKLYPQLLPFSELTMSFKLMADEKRSEQAEQILSELHKSKISFNATEQSPTVYISFEQKGSSLDINYNVQLDGDYQQTGALHVGENEINGAGKLLAYRLFGVQKTKIGEQPPPVPKQEKEKKEEQAVDSNPATPS